jgi:DNA-directed RNA polymerase sigma subunit (sigma70/sigma32)
MVSNVIQAIENYDPSIEAKFSSFLRGYLKNAISTAYKDTFLIRHPYRSRMETIKKIKALQDGETENRMTPREKKEMFEEFVQALTPDVSFFEDTEWEPGSVVDSALPTNCAEPVDAMEQLLSGEKLYLLGHVLAYDHPLLSPKEKLVIKHRYGVFGHEKLTLEEVAERFHSLDWRATKEWVFQLEKRALDKIRAHFQLYALE